MRFWISLGYLVLTLAMPRAATAANVAEFIDFSLLSTQGDLILPARLYVPPEAIADPTTMRPLVVFLHGGGERGTDNLKQMHPNIDLLFAEAKRRGAFLLAPQAPQNWRPQWVTDSVLSLVERSQVDFNVDPDRLYLTGYSSGGGGAWNMLSRYPGTFAATVPVAPVSAEPDFVPANLVGQPIAAFHARDDAVASVNVTRGIINSVLTAAGKPLPTYPGRGVAQDLFFRDPELDLAYIETTLGGHGVHFAVYNTPQLYDWMFSHGVPVPEPGSLVVAGMSFTAVAWRSRRRRAIRGASPTKPARASRIPAV